MAIGLCLCGQLGEGEKMKDLCFMTLNYLNTLFTGSVPLLPAIFGVIFATPRTAIC